MNINLLKDAIKTVYNMPYVITESRSAPSNAGECIQGLFSAFSVDGLERIHVYLFGKGPKIGGVILLYPHAVYIAENALYDFRNPNPMFNLIRVDEEGYTEQTFKGMCYAYPVIKDYSRKAVFTC